VDALVYRELRTRVSSVKGGFLGVLLQPLGLIAIWMLFLALLGTQRGGSLNVVLFLSSGINLFTIFSQIANRSLTSMEANEALLFYKPVKPIDTIIARAITESSLYTCCLIIIMVGSWIYLDQIYMSNLGLFFISILGMTSGAIAQTGWVGGKVFHDNNENCSFNSNEEGLPFRMVKISLPNGSNPQYTMTDSLGNYSFRIPIRMLHMITLLRDTNDYRH
jgi:capsular polysaccharide transport system permease protein